MSSDEPRILFIIFLIWFALALREETEFKRVRHVAAVAAVDVCLAAAAAAAAADAGGCRCLKI